MFETERGCSFPIRASSGELLDQRFFSNINFYCSPELCGSLEESVSRRMRKRVDTERLVRRQERPIARPQDKLKKQLHVWPG